MFVRVLELHYQHHTVVCVRVCGVDNEVPQLPQK